MGLVPCPSCQRHVRLEERACPFCDASFDEATRARRAAALRPGVPLGLGLKRALVYAIGTGTLVLTNCQHKPNATESEPATPLTSEPESPPTEPDEEYELQWRTLTEEELAKLVHPPPPPPQGVAAPKAAITRKKAPPCPWDDNPDAMYGGCF